MSISVLIESITFSDVTKLDISPNDIVVIVGPNNAGKSKAPQEIATHSKLKTTQGVVVKEMTQKTLGNNKNLQDWLENNTSKIVGNTEIEYAALGLKQPERVFQIFWQNAEINGLTEITGLFICHLTTETRLLAANPPVSIAFGKDALTHPIHYMQFDDVTEARISNLFKQAFGMDLIVNRNAGNHVPLHCGPRPKISPGEDRISKAYLDALNKLPTLHSQGDGMRSFIGILLHTIVIKHFIILLDEPEAFLHPPQARLIGKILLKEIPDDRQLFIATHSGDFLKGLLDSSSPRVRIVRIRRENNINIASQLDSKDIQDIWNDPLLRYSNILDGLFHEQVILCESDSDCRFYSAIMDTIYENQRDLKKPDLMFTHCGGKHRLPMVIRALRKIEVPLVVVADFDVLREEKLLKKIFVALGGTWTDIEKDWRTVTVAIEQRKPELSTDEVRNKIEELLKSINKADSTFPKHIVEKIQKELRRSSPWATAKEVGKPFIPSGEPSQAYEKLQTKLKEKRLFIVEVGELEGFVRTVSNHGPEWVNEVMSKNLLLDLELEPARAFVRSLIP